jgi:hypothetical protein
MKTLMMILPLACLMTATTVSTAHAIPAPTPNANPIAAAVIAHPAVTALLTLFNQTNSNTCPAVNESDVQTVCFGALPNVTQPTIAGTGCAFSLTLSCTSGGTITISGMDQGYEIVDQNHHAYGQTQVGIVISAVTMDPR